MTGVQTCALPIYSLEVTEKEGKLLKELHPDYAVSNKNAKATAQHLKDLFSNLED